MHQKKIRIIIVACTLTSVLHAAEDNELLIEKFLSLGGPRCYSPVKNLYEQNQELCKSFPVDSNGILTPQVEVDLLVKKQLGELSEQKDGFYQNYMQIFFTGGVYSTVQKSERKNKIIEEIKKRSEKIVNEKNSFVSMINALSDVFAKENERSKFDRSCDETFIKPVSEFKSKKGQFPHRVSSPNLDEVSERTYAALQSLLKQHEEKSE